MGFTFLFVTKGLGRVERCETVMMISTLAMAFSMDPLTIFGLVAVTLMLVCYALEDRSPGYVLAFAFACVLGSAYGFMQGAWPFGLVEGVWSVVAFRRWWTAKPGPASPTEAA